MSIITEVETLLAVGKELEALGSDPNVKAQLLATITAIKSALTAMEQAKQELASVEAQAVKIYGVAKPEVQAILLKIVPTLVAKPAL